MCNVSCAEEVVTSFCVCALVTQVAFPRVRWIPNCRGLPWTGPLFGPFECLVIVDFSVLLLFVWEYGGK